MNVCPFVGGGYSSVIGWTEIALRYPDVINDALIPPRKKHDGQRDNVCSGIHLSWRDSPRDVARVVATLREQNALEYTVVVVTEGNDPPGLAYIAPFAAASIAEAFMETGQDVQIVYDDQPQHVRAYRELSLLLRRPPGRETSPGDISYIHISGFEMLRGEHPPGANDSLN